MKIQQELSDKDSTVSLLAFYLTSTKNRRCRHHHHQHHHLIDEVASDRRDENEMSVTKLPLNHHQLLPASIIITTIAITLE